jgi:hypothetical protein
VHQVGTLTVQCFEGIGRTSLHGGSAAKTRRRRQWKGCTRGSGEISDTEAILAIDKGGFPEFPFLEETSDIATDGVILSQEPRFEITGVRFFEVGVGLLTDDVHFSMQGTNSLR